MALVPDGEAKDIVTRLRRGEIAPVGDPNQVAAKIELLYDKYLSGSLEAGYDLSVVEEFQRRRGAMALAALLDDLVGGHRV